MHSSSLETPADIVVCGLRAKSYRTFEMKNRGEKTLADLSLAHESDRVLATILALILRLITSTGFILPDQCAKPILESSSEFPVWVRRCRSCVVGVRVSSLSGSVSFGVSVDKHR